ncbi:hypothetical protein BDU57DRAFT_529937 [Ampelomyces quisqualis]|uniref:Uncharacterized protein n=1 Tax=Ampelomyces quisqualis TaxID=50730 RepID=A0A6A5QMK3_AMPQU|nr:hypothetical protein BDU57DRAFT_529937 [Ampelomyces quisqualis]
MNFSVSSLLFAMLFVGDIWAVYGVALPPQVDAFVECENCKSASVHDGLVPVIALETPSAIALDTHVSPVVTAPAAPPVDIENHTSSSIYTLSTGAKAGIGIGVTVFVFLVACLIFGTIYLRNWQRTRALQRAVEEVERGTEMQKAASHGSITTSESKENMVLESRVEIVVGDDESERDVVAAWDGWDATWEEGDDMARGRKGMSLPRRVY